MRSMVMKIIIKIKSIEASCIADVKSYIPYQVLKIPVVKVDTAKWSTAPKSDRVSIATIIVPATKAGLTTGIANLKKTEIPDKPKVLPISKIDLD